VKGLRKSWWILSGFALGLAVFVIASNRETRYQGLTITEYSEIYDRIWHGELTRPGLQETGEAFCQMGSNAVPYLLKWIRYQPPPWQENLLKILDQTPPPFRGLATNFTAKRRREMAKLERRRKVGSWAFEKIGSNAAPAIHQLERLALDPGADTSARATTALGNIGQTALPSLCRVASSPQASSRFEALNAIARLGAEPSRLAPVLASCLQDTNQALLELASMITTNSQPEPAVFIPLLSNLLERSENTVPDYVVKALGSFGRPARPAVVRALDHWSYSVRSEATNALLRMETDAGSGSTQQEQGSQQ
jgi:hypothetical protein